MKQRVFTIFVVLAIVGLLTAVVLGSKSKKTDTEATQSPIDIGSSVTPSPGSKVPIFFYGNTCPHCADVEAWMKENKIEGKISIIKKEVYDNQQNAQELTQVVESCGLPTDSIGVPFLYTEDKCLIGTPDIIDYLTEKTKAPVATDSAERRTE